MNKYKSFFPVEKMNCHRQEMILQKYICALVKAFPRHKATRFKYSKLLVHYDIFHNIRFDLGPITMTNDTTKKITNSFLPRQKKKCYCKQPFFFVLEIKVV